mgnify:CR=1 FL=1
MNYKKIIEILAAMNKEDLQSLFLNFVSSKDSYYCLDLEDIFCVLKYLEKSSLNVVRSNKSNWHLFKVKFDCNELAEVACQQFFTDEFENNPYNMNNLSILTNVGKYINIFLIDDFYDFCMKQQIIKRKLENNKKFRELKQLAARAIIEIDHTYDNSRFTTDEDYLYFLTAIQTELSKDIRNYIMEDIQNGIYKE